MKKNFSILMLIVSINQILGHSLKVGEYKVELSDEKLKAIQEETSKFGQSVTLGDISQCRDKNIETSKTIKQCYDEHQSLYEEKMRSFKEKITDAVNNLKNAFKKNYWQQVDAAQKQLSEMVTLLEEYPDYLSKTISNFLLAKKKILEKGFAFRKHLEGLYALLLDIQSKGGNKANELQTNLRNIVEDMKRDCAEIVQQIKTCMGEK